MLRLFPVAVLLACCALAHAGPGDDPDGEALFAALASASREERREAFRILDQRADLGGVRLAIEGVRRVLEDRAGLLRGLREAADRYETARVGLYEAQQRVQAAQRRRASAGRLRLLEQAVQRAGRHHDGRYAELEGVRSDVRTSRALLRAAARATGALLRRLGVSERSAALVLLRAAWAGSEEPETWLLWVDGLVASNRVEAADELEAVVEDARRPGRLRALALDGLVGLGEGRAARVAIAHLGEDLDAAWHLPAAAIAALRSVRRKEGVPALIAFLARERLGRLRGDAHAALVALTHHREGPYAGPWEGWWKEVEASFEIPPSEPREGGAAGDSSNTAFYGIHTWSDRIAFVLDTSASMGERAGEERRLDTALRELRGAVGTLDETRRFAVVWFGTEVGAWAPDPVPGSEHEKGRLTRWGREVEPRGNTNAFGALGAAFDLARRGAGRPLVDTVFFLTDGIANAGLLTATADLLPEVRAWCRIEQVQIHAIGVGAQEAALLEGLARAGRGRHLAR